MTGEPGVHSDVCALPGCDNVIVQIEGRPRRRYCSAAHRAAARQLRSRDAASVGQARPPPPASAAPPTGTTDAGIAAVATGPAKALADPSPTAAGRHRVVFAVPRRLRQARRAGFGDRAQRRSLNHRRRVGVVLTAALVALGASAWAGVTSVRMQQPPTLPPAGPPAADANQWASQAELRLAALNEQLDWIAQTEAAWKSQRHSGPPPPEVVQLAEVKTQLELQRTVLLGQMATWRSVPDVQSELADLERQVARVEQALSGLPGSGTGAPEGTIGDLTRQHEMWINRRDAKKAELDRLRAGVESAVETPMPAVPDLATPTVEAVRELLDPGRPDPPSRPEDPPATPRGEEIRRPKDEVGVGAPPDPRGVLAGGPGDVEPAAKAGGPGGGAVGGALDTASSVVPIDSRGRAGATPATVPTGRSSPVGALLGGLPAEDAAPVDSPIRLAMDMADRYGYGELAPTAGGGLLGGGTGGGGLQPAHESSSGRTVDEDSSFGSGDSAPGRSSADHPDADSVASSYLAPYGG